MILRREIVVALAFWLLVAGLVWLRVEVGPLDPRQRIENDGSRPYPSSSLRTSLEADRSRPSAFPDGR